MSGFVDFLDVANRKIWVEIQSERVALLLMEVWHALPEHARQDAKQCINKITDLWPLLANDEKHLGLAVPRPWGSEIYLFPEKYTELDDGIVRFVIAHEIAHGIWHNPNFSKVIEKDESEFEEWADGQADEWGFPRPGRAEAIKAIYLKYFEEPKKKKTPKKKASRK